MARPQNQNPDPPSPDQAFLKQNLPTNLSPLSTPRARRHRVQQPTHIDPSLRSASASHETPTRHLGKGFSGRLASRTPARPCSFSDVPPRRMTEHRSTIILCGGTPKTETQYSYSRSLFPRTWVPVLQPARIVKLPDRSQKPSSRNSGRNRSHARHKRGAKRGVRHTVMRKPLCKRTTTSATV